MSKRGRRWEHLQQELSLSETYASLGVDSTLDDEDSDGSSVGELVDPAELGEPVVHQQQAADAAGNFPAATVSKRPWSAQLSNAGALQLRPSLVHGTQNIEMILERGEKLELLVTRRTRSRPRRSSSRRRARS